MKKKNASDKTMPLNMEPLAMVGSGQLRAVAWNDDEGDVCLTIFREDPKTLEIGNVLRPDDVEDLAKLTAVLAEALRFCAKLDQTLDDDLGCLVDCLSKSLGLVFEDCDSAEVKKRQ